MKKDGVFFRRMLELALGAAFVLAGCDTGSSMVAEPPPPAVPSVELIEASPATASTVVAKGGSQRFKYTATIVNGADSTVTWSVAAKTGTLKSGGTTAVKLDSEIGNAPVLTVDPAETATELTVKAVSTFDPSKVGTWDIKVATLFTKEVAIGIQPAGSGPAGEYSLFLTKYGRNEITSGFNEIRNSSGTLLFKEATDTAANADANSSWSFRDYRGQGHAGIGEDMVNATGSGSGSITVADVQAIELVNSTLVKAGVYTTTIILTNGATTEKIVKDFSIESGQIAAATYTEDGAHLDDLLSNPSVKSIALSPEADVTIPDIVTGTGITIKVPEGATVRDYWNIGNDNALELSAGAELRWGEDEADNLLVGADDSTANVRIAGGTLNVLGKAGGTFDIELSGTATAAKQLDDPAADSAAWFGINAGQTFTLKSGALTVARASADPEAQEPTVKPTLVIDGTMTIAPGAFLVLSEGALVVVADTSNGGVTTGVLNISSTSLINNAGTFDAANNIVGIVGSNYADRSGEY
jgi:hypothetical protein